MKRFYFLTCLIFSLTLIQQPTPNLFCEIEEEELSLDEELEEEGLTLDETSLDLDEPQLVETSLDKPETKVVSEEKLELYDPEEISLDEPSLDLDEPEDLTLELDITKESVPITADKPKVEKLDEVSLDLDIPEKDSDTSEEVTEDEEDGEEGEGEEEEDEEEDDDDDDEEIEVPEPIAGVPFSMVGDATLNLPFGMGKVDVKLSARWEKVAPIPQTQTTASKKRRKQRGRFVFEGAILGGLKIPGINATIKSPKIMFASDKTFEISGTASILDHNVIVRIMRKKVYNQTTRRSRMVFVFRGELEAKDLAPFKGTGIPGLKDIKIRNAYIGIKKGKGKQKGLFIGGTAEILGIGANVRLNIAGKIAGKPKISLIAKPPQEDFHAEDMAPALKAIKHMLQDFSLIASTYSFRDPKLGVQIGPGITLMARVDASQIPELKQLFENLNMDPSFVIAGTIGKKPSFSGTLNLNIELFGNNILQKALNISVPDNIPLPTVIWKNLAITFGGIPPAFTFKSSVEVIPEKKFEEAPLLFTGGLSINLAQPIVLKIAASMAGAWKNPYGVRGFSIEDLGFQFEFSLMANPPYFMPRGIGFTGTQLLGKTRAEIALLIDTKNPTNFAFASSMKNTTLKDLMEIPRTAGLKIRTNLIPDIGYKDCTLIIAPFGEVMIGDIIKPYPMGITAAGSMQLLNTDARVRLNISTEPGPSMGIKALAKFPNFKLGPLLITGKGPDGEYGTLDDGPIVDIEFTPKEQRILISGLTEFLNSSGKIEVILGTKGLNFDTQLKLFDIFDAQLIGKTSGQDIAHAEFDLEGHVILGEQKASLKGHLDWEKFNLDFNLPKFTLYDTILVANQLGADISIEDLKAEELPDIGFNNLNYKMPTVKIGLKKYFKEGLHFKGDLNIPILDKKGRVTLSITKQGITASGFLEKIVLGPAVAPFFELTGRGPDKVENSKDDGPAFNLNLTQKKPAIYLSGMLNILGTGNEGTAILSKDSLEFKVSQRLIGIFGMTLHGRYGARKEKPTEKEIVLSGEVEVAGQKAKLTGLVTQEEAKLFFQLKTLSLQDIARQINQLGFGMSEQDILSLPDIKFENPKYSYSSNFKDGLTFDAKVNIPIINKTTFISAKLSKDGFFAKGSFPKLNIGPLGVSGAGLDEKLGTDDDGPVFNIELSKKKTRVYIDAIIENFFDRKTRVQFVLGKDELRFELHESFLDNHFKLKLLGRIGTQEIAEEITEIRLAGTAEVPMFGVAQQAEAIITKDKADIIFTYKIISAEKIAHFANLLGATISLGKLKKIPPSTFKDIQFKYTSDFKEGLTFDANVNVPIINKTAFISAKLSNKGFVASGWLPKIKIGLIELTGDGLDKKPDTDDDGPSFNINFTEEDAEFYLDATSPNLIFFLPGTVDNKVHVLINKDGLDIYLETMILNTFRNRMRIEIRPKAGQTELTGTGTLWIGSQEVETKFKTRRDETTISFALKNFTLKDYYRFYNKILEAHHLPVISEKSFDQMPDIGFKEQEFSYTTKHKDKLTFDAKINIPILNVTTGVSGEIGTKGIILKGWMPRTELGPLSISGESVETKDFPNLTSATGPLFYAEVSAKKQIAYIDGTIENFFGRKTVTRLSLSKEGVDFKVSDHYLDGLLKLTLDGHFGTLEKTSAKGLSLSGTYELMGKVDQVKARVTTEEIRLFFYMDLVSLRDYANFANKFGAHIPKDFIKKIPEAKLKKLQFEYSTKYPQSLDLDADITIPLINKQAKIKGRLSKDGFTAKGDFPEITIGPFLHVTGTDLGKPKKANNHGPQLSIALTKEPHIYIDGAVNLFGQKRVTHIDMSKDGVSFTHQEILGELFKLTLRGESYQTEKKRLDFLLQGTFENNLMKAIEKAVFTPINSTHQELFKKLRPLIEKVREFDAQIAQINKDIVTNNQEINRIQQVIENKKVGSLWDKKEIPGLEAEKAGKRTDNARLATYKKTVQLARAATQKPIDIEKETLKGAGALAEFLVQDALPPMGPIFLIEKADLIAKLSDLKKGLSPKLIIHAKAFGKKTVLAFDIDFKQVAKDLARVGLTIGKALLKGGIFILREHIEIAKFYIKLPKALKEGTIKELVDETSENEAAAKFIKTTRKATLRKLKR